MEDYIGKLEEEDYSELLEISMQKFPTHYPNKEQKIAFDKVVLAIKNANKKGLVFSGMCDELIAHTTDALEYANNNMRWGECGITIPYLSSISLSDSGADDPPTYKYEDLAP